MLNRFILLILISIFADPCLCQNLKAINNNVGSLLSPENRNHSLFKLSTIIRHEGSASIGLSYGMWREGPTLQYSLNTGCMWRFGKRMLGNYRNGERPNDNRTKSQFVFMFSPMLSVNITGKDYVYQEIEPFYFGTPNAVFCKYRDHLTLGSTFTISPRGTYDNITTIRNRSQQVFMIALNLKRFNLTIYDDYFPFFTEALQLGDNWDRFFTGGGFARYRFSNEITMHIYSEVYTGVNRANTFLYPNLISYQPRRHRWRLKNFANQDAGQEFFNSSWMIAKINYTSMKPVTAATGIYTPEINFFIGSSAPWTMFSQNFIHDRFKPDRKNDMELHYFLPRTRVPGNLEAGGSTPLGINIRSLFVGGGIDYNIK